MKSALIQSPILIIDRDGLIGEPLFVKLSKEFPVVFVSRSPLANVKFVKKFPVIPDNKYSQIIFIDEEGRSLEILPKIINKVRDINADFIFVQGLSPKGEYSVSKILRLCPSAKTVIFGDIFDKQLILSKENFRSVINKFIFQAQKFGKMQVLGDGLGKTYPVFLSDAVDGLIDLIFGMHRSGSLFYLFPKPAVPEISLAHMIQRINPEIKVDFIRGNSKLERITFPLNGKNLLGDKYPLAKRIREIDIKKKAKERERGSNKATKGIKIPAFFIQHRFGAGFIVWTGIFLLLSPFIFTLLFSFLGLSTLSYTKKTIDTGNFPIAKSSSRLSQAFFYLGKQTINILSSEAKIIGQEKKLKRLSEDISLGSDLSAGLGQILNFENYFSEIISGKSKDPVGDFAKGRNAFKRFVIVLDKLRAEEKIPLSISQSLEKINPLIKLLSATTEILPSLLGMDGEKTYLILFQDNMELRPGGGIINSYGVLKLNQGKITQFTVNDVSDADKQLKGHVEPPFGLRRYLLQKHWYMKDSNFDADFVKAASSAANFLFVETGQKTDGVIGIDSSLRAKLAGARPPFLMRAETISNALLRKHLLLTFNGFQNIFTVNGWASSLWDGREENKETVNDFIGISEANLGLNKINNFIKRQISQKVVFEDSGSISEELTISYKNESKVLPGTDYKNYLRIILPKETLLSEISINSLEQKIVQAITDPLIYEEKNFKPPQGLEVETTQEDGKTIFGFLVKIPDGKVMKIKLKYILDKKIFGLNNFAYNLKIFKQPGADSLNYNYSFAFPNNFNVINKSEGVVVKEGKISFSETISGDKNLMFNFTR